MAARRVFIFFSEKVPDGTKIVAIQCLRDLEDFFSLDSREWSIAQAIFSRSPTDMVEVWSWQ